MRSVHVKVVAEADGELHLCNLPIQKGDAVEAIVIVPDGMTRNRASNGATISCGMPRGALSVPPDRIRPARNCMNAVDTDVWIYCYDKRDAAK